MSCSLAVMLEALCALLMRLGFRAGRRWSSWDADILLNLEGWKRENMHVLIPDVWNWTLGNGNVGRFHCCRHALSLSFTYLILLLLFYWAWFPCLESYIHHANCLVSWWNVHAFPIVLVHIFHKEMYTYMHAGTHVCVYTVQFFNTLISYIRQWSGRSLM